MSTFVTVEGTVDLAASQGPQFGFSDSVPRRLWHNFISSTIPSSRVVRAAWVHFLPTLFKRTELGKHPHIIHLRCNGSNGTRESR